MEKTTLKTFIYYVKQYLKKFLMSELSKRLFGAALTGLKGYIFSFAVSEIVWPYTEKILNAFAVKGYLIKDKVSGYIIAKKIDKARDNNDSNSYDDIIDKL